MQLIIADQRRVHHRKVDVLADACALAHDHGGEQRDEPMQAGIGVGDGERQVETRAFAARDAIDQPKLGMDDGRVGRALRFRSVAPEARDRQHDQLRVRLRQRLIADAETVHHVGPEILDQHVRLADQRQREFLCARRAQVDRDASLAGVDHVEIAGDARRHPAPQPA